MGATGYHCTAKAVSFGKGQSAVHTAAYNARERLYQEREGRETKDYGQSRHSELLFSGIFAPAKAPEWTRDRQELWNRAEAAERQNNGQPARNFTLAFPHQLNQQQREWLLKDFAREEFARKGMIADAVIHAPDRHGDERNFHAHLLVTMRRVDGDEFAKTKCREWNSKEQLNQWRAQWAERGANALARAGYELEAERWRHGNQTLAKQRAAALERGDLEFAAALDGEATLHKGAKSAAMERRGVSNERLVRLADIIERNDIRLEMRALDSALTREAPEGREPLARISTPSPAHSPDDEERKRTGSRAADGLDWTQQAGMAAQQRSAMEWVEKAQARADEAGAKRGEVSERTLAAAVGEKGKEKTDAEAKRQAKIADLLNQMRGGDGSQDHTQGRERTRED